MAAAIVLRAVIGTPLFAQFSTAVDGVRLSLHVLAATIWVGGQFTLGGPGPDGQATRRRSSRSSSQAHSPG